VTAVKRWQVQLFPAAVLLAVCAVAAPASAQTSIVCPVPAGADSGYSCATGGYAGQNPTSWPVEKWSTTNLGFYTWASVDAGGNRHNCTLYAAYRVALNGAYEPWFKLGDAGSWDNTVPSSWLHSSPMVGMVANWDGRSQDTTTGLGLTAAGHVAYVEVVTSSYIEVTEDNFAGPTRRRHIDVGSPAWPNHFISFPSRWSTTPPTTTGVNTAPTRLNVRGTPSTSGNVLSTFAPGSSYTITCWVYGSYVSEGHWPSAIWDKVSFSLWIDALGRWMPVTGYVTDSWTQTSGDIRSLVPYC